MTNETDYRSHPALNASFLKQVLSYSYWKAIIPTEATPAMQLGTAAHHAILEPDVYADQYRVFDGDRRTKAGKELWAELQDTGKTILKRQEYEQCLAMTAAVRAHDECRQILDGSDVEMALFFDHPERSVSCKAQIDIWRPGLLVDLKTTNDINQAQRKFFDLHYDLQLYWYQLALEQNEMPARQVQVLFVETSAPYRVALFDVPDAVLANGRAKALAAIDKLNRQKDMPAPELITGSLEVPAWSMYECDESPFDRVN